MPRFCLVSAECNFQYKEHPPRPRIFTSVHSSTSGRETLKSPSIRRSRHVFFFVDSRNKHFFKSAALEPFLFKKSTLWGARQSRQRNFLISFDPTFEPCVFFCQLEEQAFFKKRCSRTIFDHKSPPCWEHSSKESRTTVLFANEAQK